jgi:hypothetical protein
LIFCVREWKIIAAQSAVKQHNAMVDFKRSMAV